MEPRRSRIATPIWLLVVALVAEVGLTRLAVAAMDAATAFEAWNRFVAPDPGGARTT